MKTKIFVSLLVFAAAGIALFLFWPWDHDIDTVKQGYLLVDETPCPIGPAISKIIGLQGDAQWCSFQPGPSSKFSNNPHIVCVEVDIQRPAKSPDIHTAQFQFLLNRSTGYIEIAFHTINGIPQRLCDAGSAIKDGLLYQLTR
jgi:hypothetical protein